MVSYESGLEAALKLCANEERLSAETNAMLAWGGRPAVRVRARTRRATSGTRPSGKTVAAGARAVSAAPRRASPADERRLARTRRLAYEHQSGRLASTFLANARTRAAQTRRGPTGCGAARRFTAGEHP